MTRKSMGRISAVATSSSRIHWRELDHWCEIV